MCRAGGRRCKGRTTLNNKKASAEQRIEKWEAKIEEARTLPHNSITGRKITRYGNSIKLEQNRIHGFEQEIKEHKAATEAKTPKHKQEPQQRTFMSVGLTGREWDTLESEARVTGKTRTQMLKEVSTRTPTITPCSTQVFYRPEKQETDIQGRPRTENMDKRSTKPAELDYFSKRRIQREAEVFGLSESDYMRALLLNKDPRNTGHHIGGKTANRIYDRMIEEEVVTATEAKDIAVFYQKKIDEIRADYGIKPVTAVKPVAKKTVKAKTSPTVTKTPVTKLAVVTPIKIKQQQRKTTERLTTGMLYS